MATSLRSSASDRCLLGVAVLAVFLAPFPAGGLQQEAPLQGVVVDDLTGEVIASARVAIVGTRLETRTNAAGTFAFSDAPHGTVSVRIEAKGYPAITDEVELLPESIVFMRVALPQVSFLLDEIFVFGSTSSPRPARMTRDARTAAEMLARQVPAISSTAGTVGQNRVPIVLRGVNSISLSSEPAVFLDGVRLGGGLGQAMDALAKIPAEQVRQIRVLRGPVGAFVQGSANGAVFVETKKGPDEAR